MLKLFIFSLSVAWNCRNKVSCRLNLHDCDGSKDLVLLNLYFSFWATPCRLLSPLSLNMPGWPRLSWCESPSATTGRWASCCRSRRSCRRGCLRRLEPGSSWLWSSTVLRVRVCFHVHNTLWASLSEAATERKEENSVLVWFLYTGQLILAFSLNHLLG